MAIIHLVGTSGNDRYEKVHTPQVHDYTSGNVGIHAVYFVPGNENEAARTEQVVIEMTPEEALELAGKLTLRVASVLNKQPEKARA